MYDEWFFLAGLAVSVIGAAFISIVSFQKTLKANATKAKLLGFLTIFIVSFLLIALAMSYITLRNVDFAR